MVNFSPSISQKNPKHFRFNPRRLHWSQKLHWFVSLNLLNGQKFQTQFLMSGTIWIFMIFPFRRSSSFSWHFFITSNFETLGFNLKCFWIFSWFRWNIYTGEFDYFCSCCCLLMDAISSKMHLCNFHVSHMLQTFVALPACCLPHYPEMLYPKNAA